MIIIEEKVLDEFISRYTKQFWMFSQLLTEYGDDYEKVYEALQDDANIRNSEGELEEFKTYTKECLLKGMKEKMQ